MRFWLYGPAGFRAGKVASLTVVAGITFWLGMGLVLGVGLHRATPREIGEINHLASWVNQAIGLALYRRADRLSRLGDAAAPARAAACSSISGCRGRC